MAAFSDKSYKHGSSSAKRGYDSHQYDEGNSNNSDLHSYCKPKHEKKHKKHSSNHRNIYLDSNSNDNSSKSDIMYCICRTKDTDRFMIGCDSCNEWYHGDCISITEQYAKDIKTFFCLMCREKNPSLEIKFNEKLEKSISSKKRKIDFDEDAKAKKSMRRCGECEACYQQEDCGRCDFCKDMKKFGGPNKIRQKCRYRQCLNFGLIIGKKTSSGNKSPTAFQTEEPSDNEHDHEDDFKDEDYRPQTLKRNIARPKIRAARPRGKRVRNERQYPYYRSNNSSPERTPAAKQQCYGTECTYESRPNSKYCSDACGLKLATKRIYEILPHRIQQWQNTPCVADENNRLGLEKNRLKQLEARENITKLNEKKQKLEHLIQRAKRTSLASDPDGTDELDEYEMMIYCVTCGHEVGAKAALRHMEKCFNKYESHTSYGSAYKTRIEGNNIFCDYYNTEAKTYCKRLKILCPEHSKDPKISEDEVCGCPLESQMLDYQGSFCRYTKKKCQKHHVWEKMWRAELDMEQVHYWLKLDELMEEERNIRMAMANRGGVLGLMLHQTLAHEYDDNEIMVT